MSNQKNNGETEEQLDVEHELPAAENETAATSADAEIEALRKERDQYLDRLARLQAEFDNFRKRNAREQQDYRDYAVVDALKTFLPILDSLDGAAKSDAQDLDQIRSGIELIDRQFHDALAKLGVQPIPAEGQPFDPNLHMAIAMEDTDAAPDNTVIGELQRGYKIKDRLLRPAMVRVARSK
ncbi:GrpE protein [Candidatus Koribacter versatilis Ellin345]|uniref:Protein GrpE n=1 Tax=Koribacter versatilis (strain Ellin345) TaxID=204669 RepID=Q1ILK6_KORVE|nr:nucleotide exchange factor GrpE [Candidatus Koribacter versatilis]ABF42244.1 GrpE protein [Candidatus Koribacter versatilis Ellin345]